MINCSGAQGKAISFLSQPNTCIWSEVSMTSLTCLSSNEWQHCVSDILFYSITAYSKSLHSPWHDIDERQNLSLRVQIVAKQRCFFGSATVIEYRQQYSTTVKSQCSFGMPYQALDLLFLFSLGEYNCNCCSRHLDIPSVRYDNRADCYWTQI